MYTFHVDAIIKIEVVLVAWNVYQCVSVPCRKHITSVDFLCIVGIQKNSTITQIGV